MKKQAGIICSVAIIIGIVINSGDAPVNRAGLELIGNAEACRTEPYVCPAGYWTDGIGNTHGVIPGQRKDLQRIAMDWTRNIKIAANCVRQQFNGDQMNENQLAAFTSLAFRTGCRGMRTYYNAKLKKRIRTQLHIHASAGRFREACYEIVDFVNGGGRKLPGLVVRARKEMALCLTPV